jgi:hypothetical protein
MRVAKQRANRENGRKGGLVKSLKKRIAARRNARVRVLVAARNHRNRDCVDPRALRTASNRPQAMGESDIPNPTFGSGSGSVQDLSAGRQKGHQLSFLCVCGKKQIELKTLGCCRRCYDRGYTLRGFSVVCESGCWSAIASAAGRVARGHVCWFIIATGATNRISSSLYVSAAISGYIAPWA